MTSVLYGNISFQRPEPVVIHDELLRQAVNDQVAPEVSEVSREEGISYNSVTSLKLDYRNILKIENLGFFKSITKLHLDNNIIERIENLDFLVNLTWLDLSFNNISKIEGLEKLVNLTDLTLFNNRISVIENLDQLKKLQVLSIGNNEIASLDSIVYLTRFPNLKVVSMGGNPVCSQPNYRTYMLAYLRKLCYFDYRIIDQEELKGARDAMINEQIVLEEEEKANEAKNAELKLKEAQDRLNEEAHLKGFDTLFKTMFDKDPDYQKLLPLTQGTTNEQLLNFESKWTVVHAHFYQFALDKAKDKANEVSALKRAIQDAKQNVGKLIRLRYEEFEHDKKVFQLQIGKLVSFSDISEALVKIKEKWRSFERYLLSLEMQLVEGIEEVLKDFERNYSELCNSITEQSSAAFAQLRQLEVEYQEQYSEQVLNSFERYSKGDYEETADEVREVK